MSLHLNECSQCVYYQPPSTKRSPQFEQGADKLRVTSHTLMGGKCTLNGELTQPQSPVCNRFKPRGG
jgi:hypothetical protein